MTFLSLQKDSMDKDSRGGARRSRRIAAGIAACVLMAAAGVRAADAVPVTMVLQWQHQAQFSGCYMALAKGLYAKQGLAVRILRGGPDVRPVELMRTGGVDFASMMLSQALGERAQGVPLVHLAQIVNRSNFLLVAWREPVEGGPIRALADLNGRKVTIWERDFRAPYLAMFDTNGVRPVILPQFNTFSLFLNRGADAFAGMRYNEYHTVLQSGIGEDQLRTFALRDHGGDMPEDGLYCLETTWRARPEACRAFARATLEGWRYARDHEEETLDVVMDHVARDNRPVNRAHMRWMLREILASIFPGADGGWTEGRLSRAAYERTVEILTRHGGLKSAPPFGEMVIEEVADESR